MINTSEEALKYIDTKIRQIWADWAKESNEQLTLGDAKVLKETTVNGHKAWNYSIEGLPTSRDGRQRWLLDTGDEVDTTLGEDENTIEKAYKKITGTELV